MKFLIPSLLAASVAASPLYRPAKQSRDLSITQAGVDTLSFYAQWAGAAYCNSLTAPGAAVACADSVCTSLEASKVTVLANLGSESSVTDLLGFIGYDPVKNQIGVSIRGSSSIRNWLEDFNFDQVACLKHLTPELANSVGATCLIHDGFGQGWAEIRNQTFAGVAQAVADHPTAAIVVAGHSLGAAVATLVGAELRAHGYTLDMFTYGCPRVGNEALVKYISTQGPIGTLGFSGASNYRVTHLNDPVPQVPLQLEGYAHTSPEYWLSDAGVPANSTEVGFFTGKIDYTPADIKICTGFTSRDCNGGQPSLNFSAHTSYFEPISSCNTVGLTFK